MSSSEIYIASNQKFSRNSSHFHNIPTTKTLSTNGNFVQKLIRHETNDCNAADSFCLHVTPSMKQTFSPTDENCQAHCHTMCHVSLNVEKEAEQQNASHNEHYYKGNANSQTFHLYISFIQIFLLPIFFISSHGAYHTHGANTRAAVAARFHCAFVAVCILCSYRVDVACMAHTIDAYQFN